MTYGVVVDGVFEDRSLISINAKGFKEPMYGRVGTYDEYVMKEISKSYGMLAVEGKVVVDIGANIGCFTRWALEHGAKKVIAIEPEPNNFKMLELNTQGYENVVCLNAAITPEPMGKIALYLAPSGKNPGNSSVHARRGRTGVEVNTIHVGAVFSGHPDINVAKIDCEGAEYGLMPELTKYPLEQMALEYHINGFDIQSLHDTHQLLLRDGWVATREPKIQENLWQTLAAYRRIV